MPSFTVVCPEVYDPKEDNDNSVGIRLVYGNTSFLICGDAGKAEEQAMLDSGVTLDSDVYLASHHGSEGSSSEAFMRAVSPTAVVVSAGAGNSYGHPTRTVLNRVKACGAALYRTDLQGTITVTSDGTSLSWSVDATQDYRDGDEVAAGAADTTGTSGTAGAGGNRCGGRQHRHHGNIRGGRYRRQRGAGIRRRHCRGQHSGRDRRIRAQHEYKEVSPSILFECRADVAGKQGGILR